MGGHAERFAGVYSGRRLKFKLDMSAIRSYEFELSWALLDILEETLGVTVYGITDTRRLDECVPTVSPQGESCPPGPVSGSFLPD